MFCPFIKGDHRLRSSYRGITILSPPEESLFQGHWREFHHSLNQSQDEQSGCCPGCGVLDRIHALHRGGRFMGVCPTSPHTVCFVDCLLTRFFFLDRLWRCSQNLEGVQIRSHQISSLLFSGRCCWFLQSGTCRSGPLPPLQRPLAVSLKLNTFSLIEWHLI